MAGLTKARPEKMESESGRGWTDNRWDAPGGPASPVPGPGVSQQSGPRLSSASLVYGLAAARPVAGREGRYVPCAVRGAAGKLESSAPPRRGRKAPPFPDRPAKRGRSALPGPPAPPEWGAPSGSLGVSEGWAPHRFWGTSYLTPRSA